MKKWKWEGKGKRPNPPVVLRSRNRQKTAEDDRRKKKWKGKEKKARRNNVPRIKSAVTDVLPHHSISIHHNSQLADEERAVIPLNKPNQTSNQIKVTKIRLLNSILSSESNFFPLNRWIWISQASSGADVMGETLDRHQSSSLSSSEVDVSIQLDARKENGSGTTATDAMASREVGIEDGGDCSPGL